MSENGQLEPKDVLEVGAKTLFGPVADLFAKLTGPAAEEYGLMWQDSVKMRRTKRLVSGLSKTKKMLEGAGIDANIVPDKLLLPIFEGMSVEDDESLSDMWASLLANGASHEDAQKVRPGFTAILKQMAPDEAALLNWIYDEAEKLIPAKDILEPFPQSNLVPAYASIGFGVYSPDPPAGLPSATVNAWEFGSCFDSLEAQQLIRTRYDVVTSGNPAPYFSLTYLGAQFVRACRPPAPKK